MPFVPVPDTCMIELIYDYQGSVMENVLYYSGLNVNDGGVLLGLAGNAFESWGATFKNYQSNALTLREVKATDLSSETGATAVYTPGSQNVGSRPDEGLPANCAMLLSVKTLKRGKSYRGRIYVPGLTEDQCAGSTWSGGAVTAFNTYFGSWDFLENDGEPYGMQVVSRFHNGAPRAIGVHTDVTGWTAKPTVASQRRRLPGRGR